MESDLTEEEEKVTKQFLQIVNGVRTRHQVSPISRETALKFVMARKFDLIRSLSLYESHESVRLREGLTKFDPDKEPLKSELESGKFTILPNHGPDGCAVAMFTAFKHVPNVTSHQTTLQGVVYQLDIALENIKTQRSGIIFIYNMSNSKYSNFDYELSQKILGLLKGAYPARLKKVLIVTAPLWFKAPFKILRLFVREKLRDRVFMVNMSHLPSHIPLSCLPVELGGKLVVDHKSWLQFCREQKPEGLKDLYELASLHKFPFFTSTQNGAISDNNSLSTSNSNELSHSNGNVSEDEDECDVDDTAEKSKNKENSRKNLSKHKPENIVMANQSKDTHTDKNDVSIRLQHDEGMTLEEFISYLKMKGRKGLIDEYNEIKSKPVEGTFNNSRLRENYSKNRYIDVLSFDHSAVKLSTIDNDPHSDYINANFVDGHEQKNAFISTQGPIAKTSTDFWRMVWEHQVLVIAMTTRTIEKGKSKCDQYWPLEENDVKTFSIFDIKNHGVETYQDYNITTLSIINNQCGESRKVIHMLYTGWPDYGVPSSACSMLDFRDKVREKQSKGVEELGAVWKGHPLGPPIIVHCSAGIGRTGSFITLDIIINRLEVTGRINIRETVERIRTQRAFSIQVVDQYIFCYLALIEYALSRGLLQVLDVTGLESESDLEE